MSARHDTRVAEIITGFAELWPRCFSVYERRRRPLKINIDKDVIAAVVGAVERGLVSVGEIRTALRFYTNNIGYMRASVAGAERVDLNGNLSGHVTASEAKFASIRIFNRMSRKAARSRARSPGRQARCRRAQHAGRGRARRPTNGDR